MSVKYLIKTSNDDETKWIPPTDAQVTFMNAYINYSRGKEKHVVANPQFIKDLNKELGVRYNECKYLRADALLESVGLEFPLGFYSLLSGEAAEHKHPPRKIFVYGINPDPPFAPPSRLVGGKKITNKRKSTKRKSTKRKSTKRKSTKK